MFGIIGSPIKHSLSPLLHNYWFKKYKVDANYSIIKANETDLASIVQRIRDKSLSGVNVTLPYKQKIINHIDKIVNDAEITGSVNTLLLNDEKLVIGENTFSIRRVNPDDWRTNVSLGARAEPFEASAELIQLARQAANVVQAKIAGVDILIAPDGTPTILEVNAVPGWKGLAEATGQDIALEVLAFTVEQISSHRKKS